MYYSQTNYKAFQRRQGFTLIEVLIGSAILVLLLGAFVEIAGSLRKQRGDADRLERAAIAVDRLLSKWIIADKNGIPLSGNGGLPDEPDLLWKIETVEGRVAADAPFVVIRLTVHPRDISARKPAAPILVMELLRPLPT